MRSELKKKEDWTGEDTQIFYQNTIEIEEKQKFN